MDAGSRRFAWLRRKRVLKVAEARKPRKNRSGIFSAVTLGAGAIATLLALFGIGPFAVQALVVNFGQGGSTPIAASAFFPTPSPQHKIVNVYDPPSSAGGGDDAAPAPKPTPSPGATPRPTPSPSPHPDN
jgi:hypothetical protein